MASGLQKLRREEGFSSAKEFAEEIGIPAPTYARYESNPDKIPLKQAWLLADRLHASIDCIVGRTDEGSEGAKGPVQRAYEALDPRLQHSFDDYLDYLIGRNAQLRNERVATELRRYDTACYRLEQLFYAQQDNNGDFLVFAEPDETRASFRRFVEKRVGSDTGASVDAIMDAYDRAHGIFDFGGMEVRCSTYDAGVLGGSRIECAYAKMPTRKGASSQNDE